MISYYHSVVAAYIELRAFKFYLHTLRFISKRNDLYLPSYDSFRFDDFLVVRLLICLSSVFALIIIIIFIT